MLDTFGRPLKSLRISLIDKCNLRCQYCMPEEEYVWLPRDDILTVEEIGDLVDVFTELGVDKVRLTGGEPLLRREVVDVVERVAANPNVRDLSMTTNGVLLAKQAESLRSAGLDRVSVSLDTLRPHGTTFGIIASTTEPFCRACDRSRLTADGMWFLCLYGAHGIDLRRPLREGASQDEIRSLIVRGWTNRADRGAEDRKALGLRGPLYQIEALRKDPHREMHTRGG